MKELFTHTYTYTQTHTHAHTHMNAYRWEHAIRPLVYMDVWKAVLYEYVWVSVCLVGKGSEVTGVACPGRQPLAALSQEWRSWFSLTTDKQAPNSSPPTSIHPHIKNKAVSTWLWRISAENGHFPPEQPFWVEWRLITALYSVNSVAISYICSAYTAFLCNHIIRGIFFCLGIWSILHLIFVSSLKNASCEVNATCRPCAVILLTVEKQSRTLSRGNTKRFLLSSAAGHENTTGGSEPLKAPAEKSQRRLFLPRGWGGAWRKGSGCSGGGGVPVHGLRVCLCLKWWTG